MVLLSDRLLVRGDEISYSDKIHVFWKDNPVIALAFSGLTGIRDKFSSVVSIAMMEARVRSLAEVINGIENTTNALYERYSPRIARGGEVIIGALLRA